MPDLQFSLSIRFIFLILAVLCSIAGAMFFYRITVPPLPFSKKIIFILLRSIGFFLLLFLICEPLLSIVTHSVEQPVVAVLVDNSRSMEIQDHAGRRDKTIRSILNSDVWQRIGGKCNLIFALFDKRVRYLNALSVDSLNFRGESTDIADALKSIKNISTTSNLQAVVILSDGNSTTGVNPVYEAEDLGVPVFTIGVGDTVEQKDILIRKVLTNEITYVGTKVPVNVTIHSAGFGGEHVQVALYDSTTSIDEKTLILESGTHDNIVQLSLVPKKEGMQRYSVEVSKLPDELTSHNNRMTFFTKVLKSRLNVFMLAGAPSQDVSFIYQALKGDKNIEVRSFVDRTEGQSYENILTEQMLREIDCFILVGFPTVNTNSNFFQLLLNAANMEKPFLVVLSRTIDFSKLRMLDQILPFSVDDVTDVELQVFPIVPESQRNNPVLKIGPSFNTVEIWSKLPPVFQLQGTYRPKIESQILVGTRTQSIQLNNQLIVTRHVNRKKSISILGYGLWRWKMLSDEGSETEQVLDDFLSNSIRWLTTQEDQKRIRVQPSKRIYTTQDAIEFTAQVYDDNYQPVDDAQIEVQVKHGKEITPLMLNMIGSGQYQAAYDHLDEGDYLFSAKVTLNGATMGNDDGTFSIGGLNTEYLETRMNKLTLEQIALRSGGRYYDSDKYSSLQEDISRLPNFKSRDISKSMEIEIWNSRWMLALVILIFTLEWFLRKQNGML